MLIPSHQGFQRDKNLEKLSMLIKGNVSLRGKSSDFFKKSAKTFASFVHKLIVANVMSKLGTGTTHPSEPTHEVSQ